MNGGTPVGKYLGDVSARDGHKCRELGEKEIKTFVRPQATRRPRGRREDGRKQEAAAEAEAGIEGGGGGGGGGG
jgi:hypothetical protein